MVQRAGAGAAVLGAILALGACTGSTEPASDVTSSSATLEARGTADDGRAYSFFEYGPSGVAGAQRTTTRRSWPAGASGPISERVSPLYAGTAYSFRVCGNDEGKAPVCAQTRTFTTPAAARDAVKGGWTTGSGGPTGSFRGFVEASAGQGGTLRFETSPRPTYFEGSVTCLRVSGRRAGVGAVGEYVDPTSGGRRPATAVALLGDGGPGQVDRVSDSVTFGSTPPSCPAPSAGAVATLADDLVVYDAP